MARRMEVDETDAGLRDPKRMRLDAGGDGENRDVVMGPGRRNKPKPENNAATKPLSNNEESELRPRSLSLHLEENRASHHTAEYEQEELIVRRGQAFKVTVTFDREFNPKADRIVVQLSTGDNPQESKETLIRLKVDDIEPQDSEDWHATSDLTSDLSVLVSITPAHDAIIGRYNIYVETQTWDAGSREHSHRRSFSETVCVLFNPWCKDDQVHMDEEDYRFEYVLNETGRIWQGTSRRNAGTPWNFGQFEDVALEAALYLMDKAEMGYGARSNATQIVRCLSAMSNCSDDDGGVLTGRWTDDFPKDTTVPWAWTGSVAILEEFMKTKKAVKFGQCWVFSGLVTTLLRALGIPTRSVTNFESAHDCDQSMTIDYHWNEEDEPMSDENDSVWNFHVWNESWFKRPDLPEGYDGWQAHDATPQESSEGVMRCGPSPLTAIKNGHVYLPHDTGFIFAEVNGDKVHWLVKKDGSMEYLAKETSCIGAKISTKSIGSNRRDDLTLDYKFREGSEEERTAARRAFRRSTRRDHQVYDVSPPDVTFDLDTPEEVKLGDDFEIHVRMKNTTKEAREAVCKLTAVISYYTGVPSSQIGTKAFREKLAAGEEKQCVLPITAAAYEAFMKPDSMVTVYLKGTVLDTKRSYAHVESFQVAKPGLEIQVPERVVLKDDFEVTVTFSNPLKEKMTAGVFHIEAAGLTKPQIFTYPSDIHAGETFSHTFSLSARRSGSREINANFSSDQMSGVSGSAEVYVAYSS